MILYLIHYNILNIKNNNVGHFRVEYLFLYTYEYIKHTYYIVQYAVRVMHIHRCTGIIFTVNMELYTAAEKKKYKIKIYFSPENGYRGPHARIRIFWDRYFSRDRPITHALRIQNAFLYVLSRVCSHKIEVLISARAPRIGRHEKKRIQTAHSNSSPRKTFNVTTYNSRRQSLKVFFHLI